jgi:hypothetical protein
LSLKLGHQPLDFFVLGQEDLGGRLFFFNGSSCFARRDFECNILICNGLSWIA